MTDRALQGLNPNLPYSQSISDISADNGGRVLAGVFHNHGPQRPLHEILPTASQAPFDASSRQHDPLCLEDTRTEVLKRIRAWVYGEEASCIFWLSGMAGTGKSTVARTIAKKFNDENCLGASFFFVRGGGDVSNARMVFQSIANQLAIRLPTVKQHIVEAVQREPGIAEKSWNAQWMQLIAQPLEKTVAQTPRAVVVLVVDALDECDNDEHMTELVAVLAKAKDVAAVRLRVVITSRPEMPIREVLEDKPEIQHHNLLLHEVPREIVDADLCLFFYNQLERVKRRYVLPEDWPGVDDINQLVCVSAGLFIFAATVCRFLLDPGESPEDALTLFLPRSENDRTTSQRYKQGRGETTMFLDAMYSQILSRSRAPPTRSAVVGEAPNPVKDLLGEIAALSEPLPAGSLARLLNVRASYISVHLLRLHSVVHIPAAMELPIRLFHASLRDFLFDQKRSHASGFWIDKTEMHARLANSCLRRLSEAETLKRDLCGVGQPGIRRTELSTQQIATKIPPDVAYACSYWPLHVVNSGEQQCDDGPVHRFLQKHFLHWLEALSWVSKLSSAIVYISSLRSITQENHSAELKAFLEDARRFVLQSRYIMDFAPLQIYDSALVFAPTQSLVRNIYLGQVRQLLVRLPNVQIHWTAEMLRLEGHDSDVTAVAFSPDGQVVASASEDATVRLWNAATGEQTQKLEGHDSEVTAVAFSPDGQVVASASDDATVRLWNAATGEQTQELEGHDSGVTAVAFSPDGQVVASASGDATVRLWNVATGEQT